jgi:hypothetical protein
MGIFTSVSDKIEVDLSYAAYEEIVKQLAKTGSFGELNNFLQ